MKSKFRYVLLVFLIVFLPIILFALTVYVRVK